MDQRGCPKGRGPPASSMSEASRKVAAGNRPDGKFSHSGAALQRFGAAAVGERERIKPVVAEGGEYA